MTHLDDLSDGRLPLVLGITGHRDIEDREQARLLLKKEIADLAGKYPSTPLVALSALAEGADRLFAQVALDTGIPLYIILPFAAKEYEKDFPESVAAFRTLCAQAEQVIQAPWATGVNEQNIRKDDSSPAATVNRDLQYAMAGIYLALRCHILFALWDGKPAQGIGGTAQIVNYKVHGRSADLQLPVEDVSRVKSLVSFSLLDNPDTGPVCHVFVRRRDVPAGPGDISPKWIGNRIHESLQKLDEYNALVKKDPNWSKAARHASHQQRRSDHDQNYYKNYDRLKSRHECADTLAKVHMQNIRTLFKRIFWMAGGALVAHECYIEISPHWPFLLGYLLLLGGIGWQVWLLRRGHKNAEAVDYRALAEGLRVQQVWFQAGLADQVSQHYLRRYSRSLGWVRHALQGACPTYHSDVQAKDMESLREGWIKGQKGFYKDRIDRRAEIIHRLSKGSAVFFAIGVFLACIAFLVRLGCVFPEQSISLVSMDLLIGILPAIAGLLSGYLEFAAYEDDIREYERAKYLFETAGQRIKDAPLADQQQVIRELGIEALNENANWALLHKNHDAKIPK
ncbi:hypothetical protein F6A13_03420 [Acidithiobacillus sp. 'AMD consortium']|uniref:hypothetical protein n=1 Tax=Acidithiobacillus sp. 'AMD consortium' TaxID=2614801 RepID=UPI00124E5D53|nr:hypothetical protein [Acidithiobacillus sp. 'AMD consortium']QFG77789.1 hypothetical protein F6A13_03420 [Acidithiobacillus sp. 'AMD consortium']